MGQYYTPVIIRKDRIFTLCCYDYDNGAKLMEHSYLRNKFVEATMKLLLDRPSKIAWVGDYAEVGDVKADNELVERFIGIERKSDEYYVKPRIGKMENSFGLVFINHTKKEYLYMKDYVKNAPSDSWGCIIHPIPLLTAIGNGKGGGDYRGIKEELVGSWACDEIEAKTWIEKDNYKDYKNITSMIEFYEG